MNIVNVGYDATNYYVLADTRPRLLVDVGWPGTLPRLQTRCQRMGIALFEIEHVLATHYHPDHAGLVQDLKNRGIKLIVFENQLPALPVLGTYMKPEHPYHEIEPAGNLVLSLSSSRAFLAQIGIDGEVISTPGHSDDSVTLILDDGAAFTGDLPHPLLGSDDPAHPAYPSWQKVWSMGARTIYPGHGPVWKPGGTF